MSNEELVKSKVISFRVSTREFDAVEEASRKLGFPSVSLYARAATLANDSTEPVRSPLDVELTRLWRRVEALTTLLEKLSGDVTALLAPIQRH